MASSDFIGGIAHANPWDGFFLASGVAGGFAFSTPLNIQDITLELDLGPAATAVPEPASLTLLGLGALGLLGYVWRRRQQVA